MQQLSIPVSPTGDVSALTQPNLAAGLVAFIVRAVGWSIEVAAEACGTTPGEDRMEGPEWPGGRGPMPPAFVTREAEIDWAKLPELERGQVARQLGKPARSISL